MRIAFFSTSDRSLPVLKNIFKSGQLFLCVTKIDVSVGRDNKIRENATKIFCREHNIPCIEISNLKTECTQTVSKALSEHNIDLCIVADFAFIIPESLLLQPRLGMVNVHFSLLPKYRGASPVQFAIKNGDKETGITIHMIDKGMDTGNILYQVKYPLNGTETTDNLYNEMFIKIGEIINDFISKYENGKLSPIQQNIEEATYTRSELNPKSTFISKEEAKINWDLAPEQIENRIRAYNSWPIAWTTGADLSNNAKLTDKKALKPNIASTKIKIYSAELKENKIKPVTVQPENKNKMSWESFLNGYSN